MIQVLGHHFATSFELLNACDLLLWYILKDGSYKTIRMHFQNQANNGTTN